MGIDDVRFAGREETLARPEVLRLREILAERADVIVTVSDPDGHLLWASRAGSLRMFGRTPSSFEGQNQYAYIHPEDMAHVQRSFRRAVDGETTNYTSRARAEDGSWRRVTSVTWRTDGPSGPALVTITLPADTPSDDLWHLPELGRLPRGDEDT